MNLESFVRWERELGIRRSIVLFVTLWMTWRSFAWAAQYASQVALSGTGGDALAAAAMIGAVTAPVVWLQKAVFTDYIDSKKAVPNVD